MRSSTSRELLVLALLVFLHRHLQLLFDDLIFLLVLLVIFFVVPFGCQTLRNPVAAAENLKQ